MSFFFTIADFWSWNASHSFSISYRSPHIQISCSQIAGTDILIKRSFPTGNLFCMMRQDMCQGLRCWEKHFAFNISAIFSASFLSCGYKISPLRDSGLRMEKETTLFLSPTKHFMTSTSSSSLPLGLPVFEVISMGSGDASPTFCHKFSGEQETRSNIDKRKTVTFIENNLVQ